MIRKYLLHQSTYFWAIFITSLIYLLSLKFYPSMDGPAHLYNAQILSHFLKGDSALYHPVFEVNFTLAPNWLGNILLSSFMLVVPAWFAEKILLAGYLITSILSFKLLVKYFYPDNSGNLVILVVPFLFSFPFYMGFYNYCLSFPLFFYTLYFWLKHKNSRKLSFYLALCILLTLNYFAGILTYAF